MESEKLDGPSVDIAAEKRRELLELFPEARTEGDKIDFDRLRQILGDLLDTGKERYSFTWPGKSECFKTIQAPSMATLLPKPDKSVNFDTTENLIIEGDNLEVLKLLQKSYLGKVKMIYIDPPYNTGNDFIYPDDYSESLETYLQYTSQVDAGGKKFGTNTDTEGRFHSKWLNMMYPRLYLARNLLADDGLVFISIDSKEIAPLRLLCNDLFGEQNYIEEFVWKKSYGGGAKEAFAVTQHEYCLLYAKNVDRVDEFWLPPDEEIEKKYYTQRDERLAERGPYRVKPLEATRSMDERENLRYSIPAPDGTEVFPKRQWWWRKERALEALGRGELIFVRDRDGWTVSYKQYLMDEAGKKRGAKPFSVIDKFFTQQGTSDLRDLFGGDLPLQFPKPVNLLIHLLHFGSGVSGLVMDFFAGSGTTAQAVLQLNAQDGGTRKFILVQLPEPAEVDDWATIADIAEERVRRVIGRLDEIDAERLGIGQHGLQDRGFRVFSLAQSNVKEWESTVAHDAEAVKEQLSLSVEHLRRDRNDLDIVYEVLLKSGYPLSAKVSADMIDDQRVYSVADSAFLICLERNLTLDLIRAIAARKPERALFLDEGFAGNDQLKMNAVQTFKSKNVVFRTL